LINEDEILKVLPMNISSLIKDVLYKKSIQEIRFRSEKPIIINTFEEEIIVPYVSKIEDIKNIITKISNYSLYAYEEEIKQGYITIKGGHRIGIAGECVMVNGEVRTIRNISSINIRVCREVVGCSRELLTYINDKGKLLNTLIVSPPKCGKTTMIRDLARNISNGFNGIKGKKISIIDERSEIAACFNGVPQLDVGIRTDVLDNCLKREGIFMAIRSLSPEVIICDEIGTNGDIEALNKAFNSGVNVIVTIHGDDIEDIYSRPILKNLFEMKIIDRIITLNNKRKVGNIDKVYSIDLKGEVKCLNL